MFSSLKLLFLCSDPQAGIEVLSVDGESLLSVSHPQAVDIIRKAYHNKNKATIEFVVKQSFEEVDTHL